MLKLLIKSKDETFEQCLHTRSNKWVVIFGCHN